MYVHGGENHGSGRIKIIDFGTAIKCHPSMPITEIYGSPNYMAPEVLKKSYGVKADVWSIGVICVKLVTSKLPFEAVNEADIFKNILKGSFDYTDALKRKKSVACIDFMKRCLYKDPTSRLSAHDAFLHGWLQTRGRDPIERDKIKKVLKFIKCFTGRSYLQLNTLRYISKKLLI
jgi:serine/threonine protein kinase